MKITEQKLEWYGDLKAGLDGVTELATLLLSVKNWKSESGLMNYTHPIKLVWNGEPVDCCVFNNKKYNIRYNVEITKDDNNYRIIVKKNDTMMIDEKRNKRI